MKYIRYNIIFLSILLFFSCQKEEITGVEIITIDEENLQSFEIATSQNTVDFSKGESIFLIAELPYTATIAVTFTGLTSGAEKHFSLNTSALNERNTKWLGASSNLIGFQIEEVQVRLNFYGTSRTVNDTFTISGIQNYQFENMVNSKVNGFETENWVFNIPEETSMRTSDFNAPQGEFVLKSNFDFSVSNYIYVGSESEANQYIGLPEDPAEIYFNLYVYGIKNDDISLSIQFLEDDNGNLGFDKGKEDAVVMTVPLGHKGWKLFSTRYDQMPFSTWAPGGGNGNKTHEPEKVVTIDYGLESQSNSSGSTYIDFPIFTVGTPFNPADY